MTNRLQLRDHFIQSTGWNDANFTLVAGDASNRSYARLARPNGQTAILMDAPPERGEDVRPFIKILQHLRQGSLEAPELLGADSEHGFLLLEDLGDDLFSHICQTNPDMETMLYTAAIDALLHLQNLPIPKDVAFYDLATYLRETDLLTEWYLPSATDNPVSQTTADSYQAEIAAACNLVQSVKPVLVLRDYHAENLIWLPERGRVKNVGLLDFQDALIGHPAYDLVSLLEDARRDTSATLQTAMKNDFITKSGADVTAFNTAYAILGAQRNLKIIGIFARLCIRDAKPQYINLIPRVWAYLQNDLKHPALASLKTWIDTHTPAPTPNVLASLKETQNAA